MRPSEARQRSREMRGALTRHEAILWRELKALRSQGAHFRRQTPFRGYFLDFACLSRRLVIPPAFMAPGRKPPVHLRR